MVTGTPMEEALKLLSRRSYSQHKLTAKLLALNFSDLAVSECLERLLSWGYLNDREFGRERLDALKEKLKSRAFVEADLLNNQLDMKLVMELLEEYYPEEQELVIVRRLLQRKKVSKGKNPQQEWGRLARAGFSENTIRQCFPGLSST